MLNINREIYFTIFGWFAMVVLSDDVFAAEALHYPQCRPASLF